MQCLKPTRFKEELAIYKQGKGSVQFPHDKEIPYKLLKEMVNYNLNELKKMKLKNKIFIIYQISIIIHIQ